MTRAAAYLCALLALGACGGEDEAAGAIDTAASPIADHECAACGMIVREQPAPRAELVHRDGTRAYFCSIADLITYMEAPSAHGHALAVYVEVMADDADPADLSVAPRSLVPAADATFVYGGMERPVMGEPVLTFATRAAAERAAERLHAHATDFEGLKQALTQAP